MRLGSLAFLLLASCGTTLLKKDLRRQSDGWTVEFHELAAGPDGFTTRGGAGFVPASGDRFLWVTLSVRNDARARRTFTFDSCGLERGEQDSLPLYVGFPLGTSAETSAEPEPAPGEVITRKLAFAYPEGKLPARLTCFGNVIELQ